MAPSPMNPSPEMLDKSMIFFPKVLSETSWGSNAISVAAVSSIRYAQESVKLEDCDTGLGPYIALIYQKKLINNIQRPDPLIPRPVPNRTRKRPSTRRGLEQKLG